MQATKYTQRPRTHSAVHYGPQLPAVNVKVRKGLESIAPAQWGELNSTAHGDLHGTVPESVEFDRDWLERRYDLAKGGKRSQEFYGWWDDACKLGFERAEEEAKVLFGASIECYTAGRSSGWLVVAGLPDVETWSGPTLCDKCTKLEDGSSECSDCGEQEAAPGFSSLAGSALDGARFSDGTPLSMEADIFERWAFFEDLCQAEVDSIPYVCCDLIAANVFSREEAMRDVEILRALDGGKWDTVRVAIPTKLEREAAIDYFCSTYPHLDPDFSHVFVLRDPAPAPEDDTDEDDN